MNAAEAFAKRYIEEISCTLEVNSKVSLASGFQVKAIEGQAVTLPCVYTVSRTSDITTMCWGRDSCPNSKCNQPLIWTDGYKVTFRQSDRYQLDGAIDRGTVSLTIRKTTLSDQGTYCCRIEHHGWFNDAKINIELKVEKAPPTTTVRTTTTTRKTIRTRMTTTTKPTTVKTTPAQTTPPTPKPTSSKLLPTATDSVTYTEYHLITEATTLSEDNTRSTEANTMSPPNITVLPTLFSTFNPTTLTEGASTDHEPGGITTSSESPTNHSTWYPHWDMTSLSADVPEPTTGHDSGTAVYVGLGTEAHFNVSEEEDSTNNGTNGNRSKTSDFAYTDLQFFNSTTMATIIETEHKPKDTTNSGSSDLLSENVTVQEKEKSGIPPYILITAISVSLILLVLVSLVVMKLRGKDRGKYLFHVNPSLELVTHAEDHVDEEDGDATAASDVGVDQPEVIKTDKTERDMADKQNGL